MRLHCFLICLYTTTHCVVCQGRKSKIEKYFPGLGVRGRYAYRYAG
nr:MAG TPA: hypothetical protein [Bacteriophage sp.]